MNAEKWDRAEFDIYPVEGFIYFGWQNKSHPQVLHQGCCQFSGAGDLDPEWKKGQTKVIYLLELQSKVNLRFLLKLVLQEESCTACKGIWNITAELLLHVLQKLLVKCEISLLEYHETN